MLDPNLSSHCQPNPSKIPLSSLLPTGYETTKHLIKAQFVITLTLPMAKRKRADVPNDISAPGPTKTKKTKPSAAAVAAVAAPQENGKKKLDKNINSNHKNALQTTTIPAQPTTAPGEPVTIQIVTGSYDRILHGITVSLTPAEKEGEEGKEDGKSAGGGGYGTAEFADTFLFNAHSSAIRCLALSPPSAPEPGRGQKVMLASGSSDERVNVYNISAHPPKRRQLQPQQGVGGSSSSSSGTTEKGKGKNAKAPPSMNDVLSSIAPRRILEDPRNREVGTLLHHSASVTRLAFPTRSKLLSASEDCTVAVTRTRDWALLSAIRTPAPKPQQQGGAAPRPSGDTAAPGAAPHGVADFAVHPSMKLMITVGRGERCMRLWNLMTAKKAGVLNFSRDVLAQVGEGRHGLGEGRRVIWGVTAGSNSKEDNEEEQQEEEEEEFCVEFDRDILVFGMDSTPKCRVMPDHRRKVHEVRYVVADPRSGASPLLAVSTEDGHVMFFSTRSADLTVPPPQQGEDPSSRRGGKTQQQQQPLPVAKLVAQLGGRDAGVTGRIKDFTVLRVPSSEGEGDQLIIPTGSSDGKVRIFAVAARELNEARTSSSRTAQKKGEGEGARHVGRLLGTYDTSNRITCLEAFVMIPRPAGLIDDDDDDSEDGEYGDEEFEDFSAAEGEGSGDSGSDSDGE